MKYELSPARLSRCRLEKTFKYFVVGILCSKNLYRPGTSSDQALDISTEIERRLSVFSDLTVTCAACDSSLHMHVQQEYFVVCCIMDCDLAMHISNLWP